jgi:hypothetical protein
MTSLAIITNPKRRTITIEPLGKRRVNLSPADTRDVIAVLFRSLKQLELSGRELTSAAYFGGKDPTAYSFQHRKASGTPKLRTTHPDLQP